MTDLDDRLARLAHVADIFRNVPPDAYLAAYATEDGGVNGVTYGDICTLTERLTFIMRVLRTFAMAPNDSNDMLLWRTDGRYAPITFFASCSDFFYWGTADAEEIKPEDIDALEQAFADVRAAGADEGQYWGAVLYAARKRGMRPQRPARPQAPALAALFDACGPERGAPLV